ncbi:hypothetical protein GPROT1_01765 [Gammaproteobacteria bacterium]|nr:hypothetical protein [Sandaracinaceae bacterium]CAG0973793.1 hypothetical protein GPROT1_01765 [Gammaproteobacteria bacterium]
MRRLRAIGIAVGVILASTITFAQDDPVFPGGDRQHDAIRAVLRQLVPRRVRSVGTSSVTFRLEMGDTDGSYKPRTRTHPRGYLAEIAAYRISRILGMDNLPPVVWRTFPTWIFQERWEGERADWEPYRNEILWDGPNTARGALIYWIPRMSRTDLDSAAGIQRWSAWLAIGAEIPAGSEALARDLSNMVVFDYLIANWDRFSGGNVSVDESGTRLYIRDHNGSFATLNDLRHGRLREELTRTQRFSRRTIERLVALDEERLRAGLLVGPDGDEPLLDDRQVADVLARKATILSYVGALITLHGEAHVLSLD